MGLSDHEKMILEDLEQQFQDFPDVSSQKWADKYEDSSLLSAHSGKSVRFSARLVSWMAVIVICGLMLLFAGMITGYTWQGIAAGVAGILIMLVGATIPANRRLRCLLDPKTNQNRRSSQSKTAKRSGSGRSFKERQQEKWDRRRNND